MKNLQFKLNLIFSKFSDRKFFFSLPDDFKNGKDYNFSTNEGERFANAIVSKFCLKVSKPFQEILIDFRIRRTLFNQNKISRYSLNTTQYENIDLVFLRVIRTTLTSFRNDFFKENSSSFRFNQNLCWNFST